PKGEEGSMMGNFNVALFLGFGTGPLLGGFVLDAVDMASVFYLMGGLSFVALLLVIFFLPEKVNNRIQKYPSISPFRTIWQHNIFKGVLIFRFSNAVARGSVTAFLPVFAAKLGISPSKIGFLVSVNILLTAVLQHFFGKLADRVSRSVLVVVGNIVVVVPLLVTPYARSFSDLLFLGILMGLGSGLAFPAAAALATEQGRSHGMGNVMGYFNQSMSLGMIVGPIVAGWVMDLLGLSVVFIFGGIVGILGSSFCAYFMIHQSR
ncbi:MAG: MFS transporter, partial [Candidatus Neomarinimicrobiota bacterium]